MGTHSELAGTGMMAGPVRVGRQKGDCSGIYLSVWSPVSTDSSERNRTDGSTAEGWLLREERGAVGSCVVRCCCLVTPAVTGNAPAHGRRRATRYIASKFRHYVQRHPGSQVRTDRFYPRSSSSLAEQKRISACWLTSARTRQEDNQHHSSE